MLTNSHFSLLFICCAAAAGSRGEGRGRGGRKPRAKKGDQVTSVVVEEVNRMSREALKRKAGARPPIVDDGGQEEDDDSDDNYDVSADDA
eukprot:729299-Prorocentrum_minimum.AAC.1